MSFEVIQGGKSKQGKLIVVDGLDATGKQTQVSLIKEALLERGFSEDVDFSVVSFPRYNHESAHMVESYLHGKFGDNAMNINPYLASMFYTIDRAISFQTEKWGEVYRNGGLIIADRYFTSNFMHQGSKVISEFEEMKDSKFFDALAEYHSLEAFVYTLKNMEMFAGVPMPNHVIFLTTSAEANKKYLEDRRIKENSPKDIHEENVAYMDLCRTALSIYKNFMDLPDEQDTSGNYSNAIGIPHTFIQVSEDNSATYRPMEDIHKEIMSIVNGYIFIKRRR